MAKFRKRPVVVEALQLRWDTWGEMCEFVEVGTFDSGKPTGVDKDAEGRPFANSEEGPGLAIPTLEGVMIASPLDWIIRGVRGEVYPCKPDIFEETYESVEEDCLS